MTELGDFSTRSSVPNDSHGVDGAVTRGVRDIESEGRMEFVESGAAATAGHVSWNDGYRAINGMPELRMVNPLPGRPKPKPDGLAPPLTNNLTIQHISKLWQQSGTRRSHTSGAGGKGCSSGTPPKPCGEICRVG